MARSLVQIQEDICALSDSDKEALLRGLLEELGGLVDPDVDAAWLEEAQRRSREIDEGKVSCVPADEVFAQLEASLKR